MNYLYEFLKLFSGVYVPQETAVYLPIESFDPTTGAVYISSYQSETVLATGLASLDIPWILGAFVGLFIIYMYIYRPMWFVFSQFISPSRKSMFK